MSANSATMPTETAVRGLLRMIRDQARRAADGLDHLDRAGLDYVRGQLARIANHAESGIKAVDAAVAALPPEQE